MIASPPEARPHRHVSRARRTPRKGRLRQAVSALSRTREFVGRRPAAAGILGLRNFRFYLFSNAFGAFGFEIRVLATSWLVLELTDSAFWIALVPAVGSVPAIGLTLFGGVVADRMERRTLMMAGRSAQVLLLFAVAISVASDAIELWHLLLVSVAVGAAVAFLGPAWMSIIVDLVGKGRLVAGNALSSVSFNVANIAGPALGSYLIATSGLASPFYAGFAAYVASVALLLGTRRRAVQPRQPAASILTDLTDGVRYAAGEPGIRAIMLILVFAVFGVAIFPLLPVYARDVLHSGPGGYGTLVASMGVGALAGSIIMSFRAELPKKGLGMVVSAAVWDIAMVGFAFSTSFPLSVVLLFVMGAAGMVWMDLVLTILQALAADEMLGRIMGLHTMGAQLFPVGMLVGGGLATAVSNEFALIAAAALGTPVMAIIYLRSSALRRI